MKVFSMILLVLFSTGCTNTQGQSGELNERSQENCNKQCLKIAGKRGLYDSHTSRCRCDP
jgi:hypothetical protein